MFNSLTKGERWALETLIRREMKSIDRAIISRGNNGEYLLHDNDIDNAGAWWTDDFLLVHDLICAGSDDDETA